MKLVVYSARYITDMHTLPLHIATLRFHFRTKTPLLLGPVPLGTVRSALGASLRVLACETGMPTCAGCPLLEACAYGVLFEAQSRPDALHAGFENGPRPYVLHAAPALSEEYGIGEWLEFEIRILEQARLTIPVLIRAAERMAQRGIGDRREAQWGQLSLMRVDDARTGEPVWLRGDTHLRAWPKVGRSKCHPSRTIPTSSCTSRSKHRSTCAAPTRR